MLFEISDPAALEPLRAHLQRCGCPSERRTHETFEVRVLWTETPPSEAEERAKVFGHIREWCAENPGVDAHLLA